MLEGRQDSGAVPDASTNIHRWWMLMGAKLGSTDV